METWAQEKLRLILGVNPLRANLGRNGVIYEPGMPGDYRVTYVSTNGIPGLPSRVRLRPGSVLNPQLNLPVLVNIGYDGRYEIIGVDPERAKESGYNLIQQNPGDPFNKTINQNQITTAFSEQTEIPSKSIVVKPWIFLEAGTIKAFLSETKDLTSFIPAAGYHRWVLIVLQPNLTLAVYGSTSKLIAEDLTVDEDLQECWTTAYAANRDNKPLWVWHLKDDQDVITNADRRIDVRQVINSSMTSSSSAAPPDATYIVQTPNSTLTNEQALSTLTTGYLKNTTGTGVLSVQAAPIPVADGGTGASTLTANNVLLGNGTSALQVVAPGSSGNILTSNGTTWTSQAPAAPDLSAAVILAPTSSARNVIQPTVDAIPLVLRGHGSQTVDLFSVQNSSGTALVRVASNGDIIATDSGSATMRARNFISPGSMSLSNAAGDISIDPSGQLTVLGRIQIDTGGSESLSYSGSSTHGSSTGAGRTHEFYGSTLLYPGQSTSTNTVRDVLTLRNNTTDGSTPVAGFGVGLHAQAESDSTTNRELGRLYWEWLDATDSSFRSRGTLSVYRRSAGVITEFDVIRWGVDSSGNRLFGVLGATPVARQTTYTQTYSTAASTVNPAGTGAFSGIDNAQVGSVYATVVDLNALRNDMLQAFQLINKLIDDGQAYGLAG